MTFNVEDYEHAIARIFDTNGNVIGTGFLVAPGYVLTCAHVVLQAIGMNEDQFGAADAPFGIVIQLDFPLANSDRNCGEVVAWRSYRIDGDDIAGLKLTQPAPSKSKPLPVLPCSLTEIQVQEHAVYGFANDNGDRTDAYKPKSTAPGGRFQLYKAGDNLPDETIQAGFSGAPVWNYAKQVVIGMVATATVSRKDEKSKAFAISEEPLRPVIQSLFARSLHDAIQAHLETARSRILNAVETAFWLCDTDSNRATSANLLDRLLYLLSLSNRTWQQDGREIDRLTQFAMFLVVMDGVPEALVNEITTWIRCRSFDFDALYVRANRYRQERQVSSGETTAHLVVQISSDEQDNTHVYVSIWVVDDRDRYDPLEPRPPLIHNRVTAFTELPTFLENWLQEELELDRPMIHCFVARRLLGCDLDMRETESGLSLGSRYPLVMRTDLSQSPSGKQYRTRWEKKWQLFEEKQQSIARDAFVRADCSSKRQLLRQLIPAEAAILENLRIDRIEQVFKFIVDETALPIALWVRQGDDVCQELDQILDCPIIDLPERIWEERLDAEDGTCLGSHLSLVWEDPKVIPPTMVAPLRQ